MRNSLIYLLSLCCAFGAVAERGPKPLFERRPEERERFIRRMEAKALRNQEDVKAWAARNNRPIRFKRGDRVYQVASIRNGKPLYWVTHNVNAAISSAAASVWEAPYGLNGDGVTVGVWDASRARLSHQEFGGRVSSTVKQVIAGDDGYFDHATHVVGTVAAAGVDSDAKGMAPAVSVASYDWNDDLSEMGRAAASASGQNTKIYLSNHSYGWEVGAAENNQYYFGQYSDYSESIDTVVANSAYYLPFVSAGNDRAEDASHNNNGYETISHYAVAKNVMTVGATEDAVIAGSRMIGRASLASFSSCGPCDDGRIKPDIVANGVSLKSSVSSSDQAYETSSGTSMASPSACGSAALLVEYYKELFSGGAMRASSLKGLIIHTADDRGRAGPDYAYGWGLMNTLAAANQLKAASEGAALKIVEEALTTNERSATYRFFWNGTDPIRVTLCWTDPEGAAEYPHTKNNDRSPDLVNDLDLRVVGATGTHYPFSLSYANPTALATSNGENNIDNVEQVYIATPSAGEYTITVDYDGVLSGGSQWFSLFVSGDSADADADGLPDAWEALYFPSSTGAIATVDGDGDGADNLTEYIAGTDPNSAASVFAVQSSALGEGVGNMLSWVPVEGRVYDVKYTANLQFQPFSSLSGELPYPASNYLDSVDRSEEPRVFYRVDVRLAD